MSDGPTFSGNDLRLIGAANLLVMCCGLAWLCRATNAPWYYVALAWLYALKWLAVLILGKEGLR